jgi:hypothetical protein
MMAVLFLSRHFLFRLYSFYVLTLVDELLTKGKILFVRINSLNSFCPFSFDSMIIILSRFKAQS